MKNIEVEIRGPLTEDQYKLLIHFLRENGKELGEKKRLFIDYSTFLEGGVENREKDIRIRSTNGVPEIIVKIGGWGGAESRKELSVFIKDGSFDTLAEIFGEIGYVKGVLCERVIKNYLYNGAEFAVVEVPGHSFYYEAEIMATSEEDHDLVFKKLNDICSDLGLHIFNKDDFFEYVAKLNAEANGIFEYKDYEPGDFTKKYGI